MNNICKRSLSLLLALVMVLGVVPMGALAAEAEGSACDHANAAVAETIAATCMGDGYNTWVCECGATWQEPILAAGHNYVNNEAGDAQVCSVCGDTVAIQQEPAPVSEPVAEAAPAAEVVTTVTETTSAPVALAAVEYEDIPENAVVGLVWLDKNNENALLNKVMQGGLRDLVLNAIGADVAGKAVVTYTDGKTNADVSNPTAMLMAGLAYPLYDAIAAQQTLVFTVEEDNVKKDVYIVCRNLRTAEIKISAASVSSKGAPEDLAALIDAELANVTVTVTHNGDDLTELAAKDIVIAKKSGADYTWPEAGKSAKDDSAVKVTISDDLGVYTKEAYGALTLTDETPSYTITYKMAADGAVIESFTALQGAETPKLEEEPTREYYTFDSWYDAAAPENGIAATVTGDATYIADWVPVLDKDDDGKADQEQSYTITFNYNYPEDVTVPEPAAYTAEAKWGATISSVKPENPALTGYNFAGWNGASGKVSGNVTVTATWQKQEANSYNVTYNVEGETFILSTKDGKAINADYTDTNEDYIVWKGWHRKDANGEYVAYDFNTEVTDNNLVLYGVALDDGDNDGKADGTAEDAYTVYVYMFSEYEAAENKVMYTKTVWADELAEGETYDPQSQKYAKDSTADTRIFKNWEQKKSEGENEYSRTLTYYPVFEAEENQNGVADSAEQTALNITKPGTVENPGVIKVNGKAVEGETFTRDSVNGSTITVELNGSAVVTKVSLVPDNGVAPMSLYEDEGTVEGEVVLELTYSNNYKTVTATMPADNSDKLVQGTTYALNVVFRDARALELKDTQGALDLGVKTTFTEADVYNALVNSPAYKDEAVTITYQAREAQSGRVSVQTLYNTVKSYESVVSGAWTMLVNFLGLEEVNGVWYYPYSLDEQWKTVDFKPEDGVVHTPEEIIGNYVTELSSITDPTKITELVNNMYAEKAKLEEKLAASNIHPFGYNPTGASEVKETVDIVYKDVTQELSAEGVDVVLTDSRAATMLTAADMTFTYGQFSRQNIFDKLTLTGSENKFAILLSDDTVVNKDAGTYKITATYPADDTHKSSSVTFNLTVEKAPATIIMDRGVINQETFNFAQVKATANPADAAVLQVIAGWDMTTGDMDLSKPVVNGLKGKAWVIAPDDVLELVKMALQQKYGYVPTNLTLAQMTDLVTNHRSALEKYLSKENVDRVLSFLTQVSAYVAADMDIIFGEPNDVKTGIYMNLAVLADSNYEGSVDLSTMDPTQMVSKDTEFAYGAIVISPVIAIPNRGGVQLTYDNTAKNIFVLEDPAEAANIAVTVDGDPVENTIYFYGVNGEASVYNSTANNNKAPDKGGVYVASTVYYAKDGSKVGSDAAIVFLGMDEATIDVERRVEVYVDENTKFAPDYTVTKSGGTEVYPDIVMISGAVGIDKEGDPDIKDLTGEVNIDVPQWMGDLWARFIDSAEAQKLGADERHKLPAKITKQSLEEFLAWCIKRVDDPVNYLEGLGIDKEVVTKAIGKLKSATEIATKGLELVKEKAEQLPVGDTNPCIYIRTYQKTNGKAQVTGYTDKGVYPYVGIIVDSDFVPTANAGVLVITGDPSDLIMWNTHVPYDTKGHEPLHVDKTKREGVTIIRDMQTNALTVLVEEDLQQVIEAYIEEKLGVGVMDKDFTLNKLVNSAEHKTSELADRIINKLADMAVSKMPDRFDDNVEGGAEKLKELKDTLLPKLVAKLQSLEEMTKYGDVPFTVKADEEKNLPSKVGEYQFLTFSYGMVYDSATLYIRPTYFTAAPADDSKVYGEEDPAPDYEGVEVEFYSYKSVLVDNKYTRIDKVAVDEFDQETIDLTWTAIKRAEGENVGEYKMYLEGVTFNDIFKGTLVKDENSTGTFTITPKKLTVNVNDIEKYFGDPDPIAQMKVLVDGTAEGTVLSMVLSYVGEHANETGYPLNATESWSLAVGDSADNYDLTAIYEAIQSKKMIIHKAEIVVDIADITDLTVANTPADLDMKLANKVYTVNAESKGVVDNLDELIELVVEGDYVTAAGQLKNGEYNIVNDPASYSELSYTITFTPGKLTVGTGDYVCWNMQTEVYYNDVSVALGEAVSGETVQMLKDATADVNQKNEEVMKVKAGTTFDLNGYYVEATDLISYGVVMDSEPTAAEDEVNAVVSVISDGDVLSGGILINDDTATSWTQLQAENGSYLPIYDKSNNCYRFFEYGLQRVTTKATTKGENADAAVRYDFRLKFYHGDAYRLIAAGDTGVKMTVRLFWDGLLNEIIYTMDEGTLKDYASSAYNEVQAGDDPYSKINATMFLVVGGLYNLSSGNQITAKPNVVTTPDVERSTGDMTFTVK